MDHRRTAVHDNEAGTLRSLTIPDDRTSNFPRLAAQHLATPETPLGIPVESYRLYYRQRLGIRDRDNIVPLSSPRVYQSRRPHQSPRTKLRDREVRRHQNLDRSQQRTNIQVGPLRTRYSGIRFRSTCRNSINPFTACTTLLCTIASRPVILM